MTARDSDHALLGELYHGLDNTMAKQEFEKAFKLARTKPNREVIRKKINAL